MAASPAYAVGTTAATYTLQGVIQNEGYQNQYPGARVKIRGYSRFANASNQKVDADRITVHCYAHDALGGYTDEYDIDNDGGLVDVNFASNWVFGYGVYRIITVNCFHHATNNGVTYDTNSSVQIAIP
ncbi:MAG TPA: hypothetical protein VES42_08835 [Pilimelia sp.]|nr:hypothetical protein [Pilimelia sp.]